MHDYLDLLDARSDTETFQPGEPIYLEGEPGSLLFVLLSGEVDLERGSTAVASVGPGEIFGEAAILGEPFRSLSARARTTARVAPVGPALYRMLAAHSPDIEDAVRQAAHRHRAAAP